MADGKNMDCLNEGRERTGMLQFYSNKPPVIGNKLIIFIKASKYCYNMPMQYDNIYMLTAKVYEALKSDVEYTRDKTVQYIKAKNMILEYLQTNDQITSAKIQEMCGFTKQQARSVIDKMRSEKLINLNGKGPAARYVIFDGLSDN